MYVCMYVCMYIHIYIHTQAGGTYVCTTCHRSFRRRQDINVPPPVLDDNKETCDHILWTASSQDGWLQVQVHIHIYIYI